MNRQMRDEKEIRDWVQESAPRGGREDEKRENCRKGKKGTGG